MREVHVEARSLAPFEALLGAERVRSLEGRGETMRRNLGDRAIWNINSTATGGGVAEMLRSLLRYTRGLNLDVRWLVIDAPPEFFRITKRVHNALHGSAGDGSDLGPEQAALFRRVSRENAVSLDDIVRPNDLVICHDPQTAGLVPHLLREGALVVWRCHIGHERHEDEVDRGWEFLRPYLEGVPLAVFSRASYAPSWLVGKRTVVLPPNIDPFSAKNQQMSDATVKGILTRVGLIDGAAGAEPTLFVRGDESVGRVDRVVDVVRAGPAPDWRTPLVVQVSRWDPMKDPVGVLEGFAAFLEVEPLLGANLVLSGPSVTAVADDPEGAGVFSEVHKAYLAMPRAVRQRVHLATLPMDDEEENAAIVNALQRHAAVVVQKSLQEGFGLTVTEAMWKRRPVVATAVGGIVDQIRDGVDGLLLWDPHDAQEFAEALRRVLGDDALARSLGESGHLSVRDRYTTVSALENWADLLDALFLRRSVAA